MKFVSRSSGRFVSTLVVAALVLAGPGTAGAAVGDPSEATPEVSASVSPTPSDEATSAVVEESATEEPPASDSATQEPAAQESATEEPADSGNMPAEGPAAETADVAPMPEPMEVEVAGPDTGDPSVPVEEYVPGIKVVPGESSATIYWPDFGAEDVYVVQFEKADGTWRTVEKDVEPADLSTVEGPVAAMDNQATVSDLKDGRTYTARIISADSMLEADAATGEALDLSPGGPRGSMAMSRVRGDVDSTPVVSTQSFQIGDYAHSTDNPDLSAKCGLDFALVLDSSGSIGSTGIGNLTKAANAFVEALVDTGSSVSQVSFSTASPGSGGINLAPTALTTANLPTIKASYSALQSNGWTNWQDGLAKSKDRFAFPVPGPLPSPPAARESAPDLVIFITDGNPNTFGISPPTPTGNNGGTDGSTAAVNPAIAVANDMKALGVHMFGIAVGGSISLNPIRAITSDVRLATDGSNFGQAGYTTTTDYEALATTLKRIAVDLCAPSLTITKLADTPATNGFQSADGWEFSTTVTIPGGTGAWVNPSSDAIEQNMPSTRTQLTANSGAANFQWKPEGDLATKPVIVKETLKGGYEQDSTLVCKARNVLAGTERNFNATVDASGAWDLGQFGSREIVTCTARNTLTELQLVKDVSGGQAVPSDWTLTATGPAWGPRLQRAGRSRSVRTDQWWGAVHVG